MQTIAVDAPPFASDTFSIRSSIADDVWHPNNAPAGYEWWYFDAVSDDGRDVLVIIFLANFIFSPRYNRIAKVSAEKIKYSNSLSRFPAVAFTLYHDNRPLLRAINEYAIDAFKASEDSPACHIGNSKFELNDSSDNLTYELTIDEPLRGGRRLRASFSWQMHDGDFDELNFDASRSNHAAFDVKAKRAHDTHEWNVVAPRCDVSGAIRVENSQCQIVNEYKFNGAGYHDHNRDTRPLFSTVKLWQWGRAHFADGTTAVFYRYLANDNSTPVTKLLLTRHNSLEIHQAGFSIQNRRRDIFGVNYPRDLLFTTETNFSLQISQRRTIDRSFFYLRFLSDAILQTNDGRELEALAVTEHLVPRALQFRWLDWLVNMRIGRNRRAAFLP